jgi:hypothetical protein
VSQEGQKPQSGSQEHLLGKEPGTSLTIRYQTSCISSPGLNSTVASRQLRATLLSRVG